MDEMYNAQTSIQPVKSYPGEEFKRPRDYHRRAEVNSRTSIRLFFRQNMDIVRNICIVLALLIITNSCVYFNTKRNTKEEMEAIMRNEITKTRIQTEQETIFRMKEEYGINDAKLKQDKMEADATYLATMLEAYAEAGNSDAALYLIGCSAKNRQLSNRYPNDMFSVVSAKDQYMGWDETRVPTARTKQIAKDIEEIYATIGAPMSTSYVYIVWTSREVKLIDNLEKNVPTHTFYEADMEDFLKARNG